MSSSQDLLDPFTTMSWRTEPEIPMDRQTFLSELVQRAKNSVVDDAPFRGQRLTRADVEWLLAKAEVEPPSEPHTHAPRQAQRKLDLRGADFHDSERHPVDLSALPLDDVDLSGAHLELVSLYRASLNRAHFTQAFLTGTNLSRAKLLGHADFKHAQLQGADLSEAQLDDADLHLASMQYADLRKASLCHADLLGAELEGADLRNAHLEGADLSQAHLEGRVLDATQDKGELAAYRTWVPDFPADLPGANLSLAYFDIATRMDGTTLGNRRSFARVVDAHWQGANLAVTNWPKQPILGEELEARDMLKSLKSKGIKLAAPGGASVILEPALRANRQMATELKSQGLAEQAIHFSRRAQLLETRIQLEQRKWIGPLTTLLLDSLANAFAGYGYKPQRSIGIYLLMIGGFAVAYHQLGGTGGQHLPWLESVVISLTAFHGRGFFSQLYQPGDPASVLAAFEAVIGLIIEISFIVIFTKRFYFGQ